MRRDRPEISADLGVIACCAGYGKSSYLAQLAAETPGSVLLTLHEYDNSPERLEAVIAEALPELCGCGYAALRGFTEIMTARENGLVLVDNADTVTEKAASAYLSVLCEAAAAGRFRLLLAGRRIPGFAVRLVMNGEAALYGIREMRFTRAETGELLRDADGSVSNTLANAVYSYTDGWCAGAAELVRAAAGNANAAANLAGYVSRTLLERYIESNILPEIGGDLAEYLQLTALIDAPDEGFAESVFGINDSAARADRLVTGGVLARGAGGELLFPEVMRTVFAGMIASERKRGVIDRASEYLIREKHFAEAIKLFEASGNAQAAERILKLHGERLIANYEFELIGYCGDIIGKKRGTTDPEVLGVLAQYYYYSGERQKMEAAFNMADSMFGRENRYSVCRKLYNGLLRYETDREMYSGNVRSACEYLEAHGLPLPFLNQRELDTLALIRGGADDSGKLHIYRFGTLRLTVGDNEIQCKSRKSSELIAYMLENGGKPIPREELLNMLWSGSIPTNAVAMLHNVIYGLRRELSAYGLENVIIYRNKCYMLDMTMIAEDDREIFEVCAAAGNSDKKRIAAHEAVLEKYWGRYLGISDSRGSDEQREYYDRCFVNASVMAADMCRERGEYDRELMFLKNASELDPYSEQIVCSYILCCFASGKPDKAKKKYDEYAEMINEELGIAPSKWLKNEFLAGFASGEDESGR